MKTIKYGIVGTGYFGAGLGRLLHAQEGAEVVAVYDPAHAGPIAEELGCDMEASVESLCQRADIDAVIVASPNGYHKHPVLCAAEHGKHVFCEKPIALNYDDCNEMIARTKEKGLIFMAGHVMNFMDGVRTAKKLINDGRIGELLYCHAERNGWEEPQQEVSWKKLRHISGGHLYHHIHELDFIQFLMGPAERVSMMGGNVAHQGEQFGDEDDMLFISLEFANNRFATLQYGSAFRWSEHYVKIQGTKGAILIDMQDVKVVLKMPGGEERFLLHESKEVDEDRTRIYKGLEMDGAIMYGKPSATPPKWLHGIMKKEMTYFHGIMQGVEAEDEFKPLLDGTAARAAIATADALTKSLQEDRKVSVKEIMEKDIVAK
ncbi:Gfo/Idh/MocA family oxidoreductase [Paenibacillus sp. LHD-117]|uniref:Gfo/Idh/MocA family protein n=1 Tax=Paenibacillus sp. LHD-117 TaxID=3071412 RepID=UPI0027E0E218|nr:Gfo/Idh/MocA family oxidoreductase [Paenibacillus sp. LHD-117]MDQ6422972.1 Gfo/Idh/MocA family oxidoreductase [Paenibacillus sp. LHD-117]